MTPHTPYEVSGNEEKSSGTPEPVVTPAIIKAGAYFATIDLKEGPTGSTRIGFSVWSKTFDLARPYLIEALKNNSMHKVGNIPQLAFGKDEGFVGGMA